LAIYHIHTVGALFILVLIYILQLKT